MRPSTDAQPGGQIRMVSKSGTTDFHGSLYEYLRNSDMNANTWTRNQSTMTNFTQPVVYNNFGGTVGGPVWAPGLNPKLRQKFFFFVALDWIRYRYLDYNTHGSADSRSCARGISANCSARTPFTRAAT